MKKYSLILFIIIISFYGCSKSIIKIDLTERREIISMFGKVSERNFIYPDVGEVDTLIKIWDFEMTGSFNSTSISVLDNYAFVNDLSGRVYCINLNSGKQAGVLKLKNPVAVTPVVNKNILIYVETVNDENKSMLNFYDVENGKPKNYAEMGGRVMNEIIKVYNGIVIVTENGIVYKYDFNGLKIWETRIDSYVHSSPAANDSIMVFGNDKGEVIGINISNGNIKFRNKVGSSFFSGTSIKRKSFYLADDEGIFYNIDINNGYVIWKFSADAKVTSFPIIADEAIFVADLSGTYYKLTLDGKLIWKNKTVGVLNTTPILSGNNLIVPDMDERFYVIDATNGRIKDTYVTENRVKTSPIIYGNLILIGMDRGIINAYEISK